MFRLLSSFSVAALLLLLVLQLVVPPVFSQPTQSAAQAGLANDLLAMNFLLTAEHLESNFYYQGLNTFKTPNDFVQAGFNASVFLVLQAILGHETAHAAFWTAQVNSIQPGAAVPNCTYNFSAALASPATFIATATFIENGGQTAYDGAIQSFTSPTFAEAAAQIATIEGRQAATLNEITGTVPFPQILDTANPPTTIAGVLKSFIISCPYNLTATIPAIRPTGVTLNSSTHVVIPTGSLATPTSYSTAQQANDLIAMNFALTLEHFEAAFYNSALNKFTQAELNNVAFPNFAFNFSQLLALHENGHVAIWNATINARQPGAALPPCTYNFSSINSVAAFVSASQMIENTGVMAYDGLVNTITDTALQQLAATIATVEARQAAFLNQLVGQSPFPNNFDTGISPAALIPIFLGLPFIVSCPFTLVAPQVLAPVGTSVRGDPAFVGFHGQTFQVHGIPSRYFNILSTPSLQLNAQFKMIEEGEAMTASEMKQVRVTRQLHSRRQGGLSAVYSLPVTTAFSHAGTFLGRLGMKLGGSRLLVEAGAYISGFATVELNGQELQPSSTPVLLDREVSVTLSTPHVLRVRTPVVSFTLVNSDGFVNIEEAELSVEWTAELRMDGLLGQTADREWKVQSSRDFKEHMVMDYLLPGDDAFSDDFVNNRFTVQ